MAKGPTAQYHKQLHPLYELGSMTCMKPQVVEKLYDPNFPLVLNIENTNGCNLECTFCPRPTNIRTMTLEHFKKLIDECPSGRVMLNLHKDGETLIHPQVNEMVEYAMKSGKFNTVHMNTNAVLLDRLTTKIDDLTVSLDANNRKEFLKLKQRDEFVRVVHNTDNYIIAHAHDTNIRVKTVETEDTSAEQLDTFVDRWGKFAQITGVHSWSGAIDIGVTDPMQDLRFPCPILWYAMAVNADHTVSACNVDWNHSLILGNTDVDDLSTIWKGKALADLREKHKHGVYPGACKECTIWAGFSRGLTIV